MNLEDYEQIETHVQDVRFGNINIYMHNEDSTDLIMEKTRESISPEDHEFNCLQAEQRRSIQHPSILKMIGTTRDDEKWVTRSYFEYPNEDLFDRREELVNPMESMKFLTQILEALTYLQERRFLHGDLRPEYIFFDSKRERYILLDRLGDPTNYTESQRNNLVYEDKNIFMSPEMFEQLSQGKDSVKHHPFKSECFSLGMVLLSMYTDEFDLSICYNRIEKEFDVNQFELICSDLKRHFFVGKIEEIISSFLFQFILNLSPKARCSPKKTLKILSNKVAPRILKEMENRRSRMGWDTEPDFEPIQEEESQEGERLSPTSKSSSKKQLFPEEDLLLSKDLSKAIIKDGEQNQINAEKNFEKKMRESLSKKDSPETAVIEESPAFMKQTFESEVQLEHSKQTGDETNGKEVKDSQDSCELQASEVIDGFCEGRDQTNGRRARERDSAKSQLSHPGFQQIGAEFFDLGPGQRAAVERVE